MKKWLFNPFFYIAGAKSLLAGIAFIIATAIIAFYSHTHFDGVIDVHVGAILPLSAYFGEQAIDWACMVLCFFLAGKIFSKSSIRFIDVAGTMAMARWVMIFCAVIGFGIVSPAVKPQTLDEIQKLITPLNIVFSLLNLVFIIWMIALAYNAFCVSLNMKGGKAAGIFTVTLILAEIASKILFHFLYMQIH